jgi:hypothetical protein
VRLPWKKSVPDAVTPEPSEAEQARKGRPTPTRKQSEAANRRPLVPADRKIAGQSERERARAKREREYQALRTGDERFLPIRDKGPQRRWVRDFVDARWSLGEFFLPFALAIVVATMLFAANKAAGVIIGIALYGVVLLSVLDMVVMTRLIKRRLAAKFGADKVERGLIWYGATRSMQIRRVRLPKPLVKRGEPPH